ncbi:MAG: hypothetical protein WBD93_04610, partial [Acidobacteriaceae bacterium]
MDPIRAGTGGLTGGLLGLSEAWAGLDAWMERVHPHDKPRFEAELRALRTGKALEVKNEHRV